MRMYGSTKVLLIFALLLANTGTARRALAYCCNDASCCKTCGAGSEVTQYQRSCTRGTCYVTLCFVESSLCGSGYDGNWNDCCNNTASWFCEPY